MNAVDVVKTAMAAIERGDVDGAAQYMTDDLVFSGPVPMPLGKRELVSLLKSVVTGVPNWKFNAGKIEHAEGQVRVAVRITGTHTRELPGLMPGMPAVPATNKSFALPEEVMEYQLRGEKVARIHVEPVPGGGVAGMLHQIGVVMPVP